MKEFRKYAGPAIMVFLALLLGIWHGLETAAGAEGSGDLWLKSRYLLLAALVFAILGVLGYLLLKKNMALEACGLVAALALGGLYMTVLPPLSSPDEVGHFMSAYGVSNRMMFQEAVDRDGYIMMRREDEFLTNIYGATGHDDRISIGRVLDEAVYRIIEERRSPVFVSDRESAGEMIPSVYRPVGTTPAAYAVPALGISLARLLGMNCIALVFMGRLFNLIFFGIMCFLSIRFLPTGKEVLLGVSLLPMSLHQVSSYSYDAFLLGLCFFFASYCIYLAFQKPVVQLRDMALLAALMAALGPCKIVYAVFMGFALLIPLKKFGTIKKWLLSALAVFAAFALAMIAVNGSAITVYTTGSDSFVAWAGEEGYTLPLLLHNPLMFLRLVYETVVHQADEWYLTMMGSALGNLDPVLSTPFVVVAAMTACLFGLSIRKSGEALYFTGKQKCWILFLAALCLFGTMVAMLTSWTPLSSPIILGVQGRYLLPALPFVLMTMKSDRVVRTAGQDNRLLFYMCVMNGYVLLRLFSIVSMRL